MFSSTKLDRTILVSVADGNPERLIPASCGLVLIKENAAMDDFYIAMRQNTNLTIRVWTSKHWVDQFKIVPIEDVSMIRRTAIIIGVNVYWLGVNDDYPEPENLLTYGQPLPR